MSIYDWSTVPDDNKTADPTINWQEGQNANTVNDSARAMMAALAAYFELTSGTVTTGGSSNAYTVTSPTGHAITAYAAGQEVTFIANHANSGAATLNWDGLGAAPIKKRNGDALAQGDIVAGMPVSVVHDGSEFRLKGSAGADGFPAGTRMLFQQSSAPAGWVKDVTASLNNTALRVVTGNVGSRTNGRSFSGRFASSRGTNSSGAGTTGGTAVSVNSTNLNLAVSNHTLTASQIPAHRHFTLASTQNSSSLAPSSTTQVDYFSQYDNNAEYILRRSFSEATIGRSSSAGSGGAHSHGLSGLRGAHNHSSPSHTHSVPNHTHTIAMDVNYHDVIICAKA